MRSPDQKTNHPAGAHPLGDDRRGGRAPDPHPKAENKQRVQSDVQHRPDQHRAHGHQSLSLGGDIGVEPQGQLDKDGAHQVDGDVVQSIADGILRGAEGHQHRLLDDGEEGGQHCCHQEQQGGGVAQYLFCALPVPRPQADGGQRRAAHPGEGGKGGDQHQDREGHPQPGEGGAAYHCNVADVDAVHDVVQHIDELGRHRGQGQLYHQRANRGAGQRLLAFA